MAAQPPSQRGGYFLPQSFSYRGTKELNCPEVSYLYWETAQTIEGSEVGAPKWWNFRQRVKLEQLTVDRRNLPGSPLS